MSEETKQCPLKGLCCKKECEWWIEEFSICSIKMIAVAPFAHIDYENEKPAKPAPQPDEMDTFRKVMKLRDESNDKGSSPVD